MMTNKTPKPTTHPSHTSGYLKAIEENPLLSREEEIKLSKIIHGKDKKEAKKALDRLVLANLKLAIKIANDYKNLGVDLEDLIAEAQIGLYKAAQRFNPKRAKFSTYAAWWIKQNIKRYLNNHARTVRLPSHLSERVSRLNRIKISLEQESGHPVTTETIAEITGMKTENIERILQIDKKTLSLEAKTFGEDSPCLQELLHNPEDSTPDEALQSNLEKERLQCALQTLNSRETLIITRRFGLDGEPPQTLEIIGLDHGITRERIRQIQKNALEKLRREYEKIDVKKLLQEDSLKEQMEKSLENIPQNLLTQKTIETEKKNKKN
jgi:RNA polymerase primary sigma factor